MRKPRTLHLPPLGYSVTGDFANLKRIIIRLSGTVLFGDEELDRCWPKLTDFHIFEREFTWRSLLTPAGLVSFVKRHPFLNTLTLRFDATQAALDRYQRSDAAMANEDTLVGAPPLLQLEYWHVCISDADNEQALHEFLHAAAPRLKSLVIGWEYETRTEDLVELRFNFKCACLASPTLTPDYHLQKNIVTISAMERVLGTRELIDEIFEIVVQLDDEGNETNFYCEFRFKTPRRTLPALARTSKFLSPSALRLIWHSIWSIDCLLKCLPETVLKFHQVQPTEASATDHDIPIVVMSTAITESDLTRLRFYADLVLEYGGLKAWNVFHLPDSVSNYLCNLLLPLFEDLLLLPRLRKATFSLNLGPSMTLTRLVLGKDRSLDRLRVSGTQAAEVTIAQTVEWFSWLALTRVRAHRSIEILQRALNPILGCRVREIPARDIYPLSFGTLEEVMDLRRITSLNIHAIAVDKVEWVHRIAEIPHLKILSINLSGLMNIPNVAGSPVQACFGALEQAIILADAPLVLCSLLRQWRPSNLRNLIIKRKSRNHLWNFEEICLDLCHTSLSASNLQTLRFKNDMKINHDYAVQYNRNTTDISHLTLQRLSHFGNLEALVFDLGSRVTWGDDVLHQIAQYWPNLRSFHVCEWEHVKPSRISSNGVYSFLSSLPRLKNITLRFNTTKRLSQQAQPLGHLALRQWDLCTSDANDKDEVMQFLKDTVPNLGNPLLRWNFVLTRSPHDESFMTQEERAALASRATWTSVEEWKEWKNSLLPSA
ncbi:hypothetical protein CPB83DRAFT_888012 [Crepidotus variabilis]|uniref:Uncharacterized protein n=1 Tax=Crepidotus variabilis TaxID=179855 RepID=A0A9P6EU04_9AGAR|nr:hypothetical protein CPB83DRAFT_888012 [Crepidotus variabilis]